YWTFLSNKIVAKRLELLCDLVPGTAPIGMLAAQDNPNTDSDVKEAQAAAHALGRSLHVIVIKFASEGDIDAAIVALVRQRVGMLFMAAQADFRIWRRATRCQRVSRAATS